MAAPKLQISAKRKSGQGNQHLKKLLEHGTVEDVPLDQVDRDEYQPRPLEEVMDGIEEFADELERDNFKLIQFPVFHIKDDGRKMIVVGERRTTAFRLKGRETIPAVCKRFTPEELKQLYILQYVENDGKLKKELSPLADANWWRTYADRFHEGNLSAAAKARGRSPAEVSNRVSLLQADPAIVSFVQRSNLKDPATYAALSRLKKHGNIKMVEQVITDYDNGKIKGSLRVYAESLAKQAKEDKPSRSSEVRREESNPTSASQPENVSTANVKLPEDKGLLLLSDATNAAKRAEFTAQVAVTTGKTDRYDKYSALLSEIGVAISLLESARAHYQSCRTRELAKEHD